jgi:Uma2 family endonuclease
MDIKEPAERYTYADYAAWDDDKRYELIDGKVFMLAAPTREHQAISFELSYQIGSFLRGKPCKAFAAPFDVRLNAGERDDTVVQPDIVVVCDHSKLTKAGCTGAPDMVIEILSPSTAGKDRVLKFNKYLQAGIREYWVIEPDSKTVSVHLLKNGEYVTKAYGGNDEIPSRVLDGCVISLQEVFEEQI